MSTAFGHFANKNDKTKLSFWNGQLVLWNRKQAIRRLTRSGVPSAYVDSFLLQCCERGGTTCNGQLTLPPATLYLGEHVHAGVRRCLCVTCDAKCTTLRSGDLTLMLGASVYGIAPIILDAFLVPTPCSKRTDVVYVTMTMRPIEEVFGDADDAVAAIIKAVKILHNSTKATLNGGITEASVLANPFTKRVVFMDWTNAGPRSVEGEQRDKRDAVHVCRLFLSRVGAYDHPMMFMSECIDTDHLLFDSFC